MSSDKRELLARRFPFELPRGYWWLVERGLAGFEPDTSLQPWYLLPAAEVFSVSDRWPRSGEHELRYAFARRQDSDEIACFAISRSGSEPNVLILQGWTPNGYEVIARMDTVWIWLQSVVLDIAEWVSLEE